MRFYGLGEQGTVYPASRGPLPRQLDVAEKPSYLTRGFWAWEDRGDRTFLTWMARNRLNFWCTADKQNFCFNKKVGMKLTAGEHVIQFRCLNPKAEYPYQTRRFRRATKANRPIRTSPARNRPATRIKTAS